MRRWLGGRIKGCTRPSVLPSVSPSTPNSDKTTQMIWKQKS